jgi:hypothetical protein
MTLPVLLLILAPLTFHQPWTTSFGHLLIWETKGVQHDGPIDGVGGHQDVFADDLGVGGPDVFKLGQAGVAHFISEVAGKADVVREGIEPDVVHEALVKGQWDAPGQALDGAGDAEILRFTFEGIQHVLGAVRWENEVGVALDVAFQPLDMVAEAEVPVLFFEFDDLAPLLAEVAIGSALFVGEELLLAHGVKAGVAFL